MHRNIIRLFPNSANQLFMKSFSQIASVLTQNDLVGKNVSVKGWIKSMRVQKERAFIDISDGSCFQKLQVLVSRQDLPDKLTWGSSLHISGTLSRSPRGQLEIQAKDIKLLGECIVEDGYPFIPRQNHPPEHLRQYLHLRSRTNYISSILRVRNAAAMSLHDYFQTNQFLNVNTPILTSNDCEGAGEVFRVEPESDKVVAAIKREGDTNSTAYFGNKTFLTVSGQLHLEAMARGLGNVYTFGPTFRAENSKSRLHLSEFYMLEAELAFCDNLAEVQKVIEGSLKHIFRSVLDKCDKDLHFLHGAAPMFSWLDKEFATLTHSEAVNLLRKNSDKCTSPPTDMQGLTKEHELALVDLCGGVPVFVIDWPKDIKPFYMKRCSHDQSKVQSLDLLAPITGEIVGGGVREDDYLTLQNKLPTSELDWYLELRKFGNIPTAGFGLGYERVLQVLCAATNIKDVIPIPRWPHNCTM